jgi:hypothetical protein
MSKQETFQIDIPLYLDITYKADSELTIREVLDAIRMKPWTDEPETLEISKYRWHE